MKQDIQICRGNPMLPGVNCVDDSYVFTVEVPGESETSLVLYKKNAKKPFMEIPLFVDKYWGSVRSISLRGIVSDEIRYNYRINGKIVQDPYAGRIYGRDMFGEETDLADEHKIRCGLPSDDAYVWEDEQNPAISYEDMILYELHVRGYTKQAKIPAKKRGTYSGLVEMIPYWKSLGINTIELMPSYEFFEVTREEEKTGLVCEKKSDGKVNFWGYVPGYYFAPKAAYASSKDPEKEFKDLIKALHQAQIACIMQFYFPEDIRPMLALHALQFWKKHYHVDGFHLIGNGVLNKLFISDGMLSDTKIFFTDLFETELCQDGKSTCGAALYNRSFLCDMRRFLKSDPGMVPSVLYHIQKKVQTSASVNYMVSHDGFTLVDMVSYNEKHNEANGENNRDGSANEFSWNCGKEGTSKASSIRGIRERQMKNAMMMILCNPGIPMIYSGDELGNSQCGNSNAYCQDNSIGWVDWDGYRKNEKWLSFVKAVIAFRKDHPVLYKLNSLQEGAGIQKGLPKLSFHSEKSWYVSEEESSRLLGVMYCGSWTASDHTQMYDCVYVAYNFHWENRSIALPSLPDGEKWVKAIDTFEEESFISDNRKEYKKSLEIGPRSMIVLVGLQEEKNASVATL